MAHDTWDVLAADWDGNEDARIYAMHAFESWSRKVAPSISNFANTRVLDFGCGTGLLSEKLSPLCQSIMAVDTSAKMIDVLRHKIQDSQLNNITPLVATVDEKTIRANSDHLANFGLVVASSVCSFLPDYPTTLRDIATTMLPGGIFVQWDWSSDMPADRIEAAFEMSGLSCVGIAEEFSMTSDGDRMPVIMGIGRLRN